MKRLFFLCTTAIISLLSANAFGQSSNPLFQHLPPTAEHLYEINVSQVLAKGNLAPLLGSLPPSKNAHTALLFNILKDADAAGVDLGGNIFVAQTGATGTGADTLSFTSIIVKLADSAKFRKLLSADIQGVRIHRLPAKGFTAAKEHLGLAWDNQLAVVTLATREGDSHAAHSDHADHPEHSAHPAPPAGPGAHSATPNRSIEEIATEKSLAALAGFPNSPFLTNHDFLTGFATDADVHMWSTGMNPGKMFSTFAAKLAAKQSGMPSMAAPGNNNMPNMPLAPKAPVLSTFNFGNGEIVFRMTTFNTPDNAAMMKSMMDRPFNKDLLARLPAGLLLGCMATHVNLSAFGPMLDKYHAREKVDSMLQKKGLTINDITAAFGGDFLLAAMAPDSAATDSSKGKPQIYFVASIANPANLMAIAARISAAPATTDAAPSTANPSSTDTIKKNPFRDLANKIFIQDNLLVVSSSREKSKAYFTHTDRRSTDLLGDNANIFRIAIDLKAVAQYISGTMVNDPKALLIARVLTNLDKLTVSSGALEGDNTVVTIRISTADPSANSLQTLMGIMH